MVLGARPQPLVLHPAQGYAVGAAARQFVDAPCQLAASGEKLTTQALESLVEGDLNYKLVRRRRSEA